MATQVEQLRQAASQAKEAYLAEFGKYGEDNLPSAEQAAHVDTLRIAMTDGAKAVRDAEGFLKSNALTLEDIDAMAAGGNVATRAERGKPVDRRSIGQRLVESERFKAWHAQMAGAEGIITTKGINSGPLVTFGGMRELDRQAALLTGASDTSGGAFVRTDYYPQLTELGRRPLTIRDVITNLQTGSDVVEYVRVTTEANAAAAVAEAVATSGGVGIKPESALVFEKVTANVVTIAHWIPATKRALADAAQLRGLVDEFLRYGLDEELEDQIVGGTGGDGFTGFAGVSGTQAQAWDTDLFKTLRVAKRKAYQIGRRRPTAYLLNPEDWERVELSQDDNYRYYGNGPFGATAPTIWSLPVVESEAVPVGTGYVGDWRTCVLWDREQTTVSVSDSHSDFFIRNLVAILAEMRAAFGVLKPNALVEIDITA